MVVYLPLYRLTYIQCMSYKSIITKQKPTNVEFEGSRRDSKF